MLLVVVVVVLLMLLLLGLFCWKSVWSTLSQTHARYLHLIRTSLKCWYSVLSSFGVEQIALAIGADVLITLCFAAI